MSPFWMTSIGVNCPLDCLCIIGGIHKLENKTRTLRGAFVIYNRISQPSRSSYDRNASTPHFDQLSQSARLVARSDKKQVRAREYLPGKILIEYDKGKVQELHASYQRKSIPGNTLSASQISSSKSLFTAVFPRLSNRRSNRSTC